MPTRVIQVHGLISRLSLSLRAFMLMKSSAWPRKARKSVVDVEGDVLDVG